MFQIKYIYIYIIISYYVIIVGQIILSWAVPPIDPSSTSKMVMYFFRLEYTSAVNSVPICAVHWINFRILHEKINCSIGGIT